MEIFKEWLKNSEQYYEKIDYMRMLLEVGKNETLVIRQLLKEDEVLLRDFLADNSDIEFNNTLYFLTKIFSTSNSFITLNFMISQKGYDSSKNKYLSVIEENVLKKIKFMLEMKNHFTCEVNTEGLEFLYNLKNIRKILRKDKKLYLKVKEELNKDIQFKITDNVVNF